MKESTTKAWIRQPLSLLCKEGGMSKCAAITLALIIDKATNTNPPSPVEVRHSELAQLSGYNERSTIRAIQELVKRGLISAKRTGRGSVYELTGAVDLLPPKKDPTECKPSGGSKARRRSKPRLTQREQEELEDYESLANRFLSDYESVKERYHDDTDYSNYVCAEPADPNGKEYL